MHNISVDGPFCFVRMDKSCFVRIDKPGLISLQK